MWQGDNATRTNWTAGTCLQNWGRFGIDPDRIQDTRSPLLSEADWPDFSLRKATRGCFI
jgi:hypothetical protein